MAIGVFGLQVAYKLKRLEIMSTDDTHGWFGGGSTPATVSTVDRIDFSNDTGIANIRGPLSSNTESLAAMGNSNYGWFGGGYVPAPPSGISVSTVNRIDFSNDSSTASPRGPLSSARYQLAATGNSNYGWFGGGKLPGVTPVSTVDRIDFSNDSSTASPRGPLSGQQFKLAATGNSNFGWFVGGFTQGPGNLSRIDRIDFSNDFSTASPRGPLTSARYSGAATGNSNYGWFGGGAGGIPTANVATVDRIDFSNDSASASVRGPLSSARSSLAATGNSNYGWFGGGAGAFPIRFSIIDRIDFSNDSVSVSVRGLLSSPSPSPAGKLILAATSGQAKGPSIKLQKGGNFGWFGGSNPFPISTVDRINFSNDLVTATERGPLSDGRYQLAATGNSNYGWFGGGDPGSVATVSRIDFSNDLATATARGPLSAGRSTLAATGNSNYGWFGGGVSPGPTTLATVDRIDFSNDLATASPRSPLSLARFNLAATGNSNYGWFGGGAQAFPNPNAATVDRIDFSNDSSTASPRGPLSSGRNSLVATGNSNYGWFGGGFNPSLPVPQRVLATVDRIDFSNDLATISPRGPLSSGRYSSAATGNSNYGWFGCGNDPAFTTVATVDRINFSNDLATSSPRGPLSFVRNLLAATSNTPT